MNDFHVQAVVVGSPVIHSTWRDRFDAPQAFRNYHWEHHRIDIGMHISTQTNPENTVRRIRARTDIRDQTTYFGILECFVSTRKRRLDGVRRCLDLADTWGSTKNSTQMFLSVFHRSEINVTAAFNFIHTRIDGSR